MQNSIYRFTIFNSDSLGHGGEKRTAQITEILSEMGIKSEKIPTGMNPAGFYFLNFKNCIIALRYFLQVLKITGWKFHPKKFYKTIRVASQFKGVFDLPVQKNSDFVLWEATRMEYSFIIPLFMKHGYNVIAIPHNIESFVPGLRSGVTNKMSPDWFFEEISLLRSSIVYAISREDTLLLKQMGVNAEYLPYYPTRQTTELLVKIRTARRSKKDNEARRKRILMLGSSINIPTKEGMIDRINFFRGHKEISCDLFIAGFGTEQLKCLINDSDNINLLGELTEDQLSEMLTEADALLIHQSPTSGALTRIIEALIAGVPIIANFISCRNYYGIDGLNIYYDDNQLLNFLKSGNFPVPDLPEKPSSHIGSFQNTLLNFVLSE